MLWNRAGGGINTYEAPLELVFVESKRFIFDEDGLPVCCCTWCSKTGTETGLVEHSKDIQEQVVSALAIESWTGRRAEHLCGGYIF